MIHIGIHSINLSRKSLSYTISSMLSRQHQQGSLDGDRGSSNSPSRQIAELITQLGGIFLGRDEMLRLGAIAQDANLPEMPGEFSADFFRAPHPTRLGTIARYCVVGIDIMSGTWHIFEKSIAENSLGLNGTDQDKLLLLNNDEKGDLSLSLEQIAEHPERKSLFEKHFDGATTRTKENKIYQNRDGGTSVGGGGDGTAIEFKKRMLDYAIELFQETPDKLNEVIARILKSDIEPNWSYEDNILEIQRTGKSFRIVIPSVLWFTYEWNVLSGEKLEEDLVKAVFNETFRDRI